MFNISIFSTILIYLIFRYFGIIGIFDIFGKLFKKKTVYRYIDLKSVYRYNGHPYFRVILVPTLYKSR